MTARFVLKVLALLALNGLILLFHLFLFAGPYPLFAYVAIVLHMVFLLLFPYTKFLKHELEKQTR